MLSDTERGILTRLSEFSEEIEASWDVPRALSLPGLADSLGLVRSSLHKPLSKLEEEGLVFTRVAHVIGGGSRKRKVIHITSLGREKVNNFENNLLIKNGKLFGKGPIGKFFSEKAIDELAKICKLNFCKKSSPQISQKCALSVHQRTPRP